jgi:hypothetical protein
MTCFGNAPPQVAMVELATARRFQTCTMVTQRSMGRTLTIPLPDGRASFKFGGEPLHHRDLLRVELEQITFFVYALPVLIGVGGFKRTAFLQIGQRRTLSSLTLSRLSSASSSRRVVSEGFVPSSSFDICSAETA